METSPTVTGQPARTMDEYVWLAGRPVLSIRSLYQAGQVWQRAENDWATSCPRRGVAGTCQPVGLITDVIGKPIASIDSQRRLAGVLEYDPFGLVNRSRPATPP